MRKSSTDAEAKLWSILRSRSLAGCKFRRQHPMAGYILDFYCIRHRLAVELDGGQHGEAKTAAYDARRTHRLEELGVRVLRFSDVDLLKDAEAIAGEILRQIEDADPHPRPLPAYRARGTRIQELKGALASDKGRELSFAQIRAAAAAKTRT